jgi:hypothetical protein
MQFVDALKGLLEQLEAISGDRTALMIHVGAVLLVLFVIGKLAAKAIFRSDCGAVAALLAGLIPILIGMLAWVASTAFFNRELFVVQGFTVDVALAGAVLVGLFGGALFSKWLLSKGYVSGLLFLILLSAACLGGLVISQASLTVFRSGSVQMEQSQERLNLDSE